jgi:hypothetical protein
MYADIVLVSLAIAKSPMHDVNGIDWMAQQNGGQFDPVLFGDYRDPHESILNSFDPEFFNDAFDDRDFSTPFYTGELTSPAARRDLVEEMEVQQNGALDQIAPSNKSKIFLSCDKIRLVESISLVREGLSAHAYLSLGIVYKVRKRSEQERLIWIVCARSSKRKLNALVAVR